MPAQNIDLWDRLQFGSLIRETDEFSVHEAMWNGAPVRVTTIEKQLADRPEFRATFRTDIQQLQSLEHANIAETLDWGEHAGTILYVTQTDDRICLEKFLALHPLTWEEFVDIAWQISSALQHMHNAGFTHGKLTRDAILIDDALRITISEFGLHRWIKQVQSPMMVPLYQEATQADLDDFGILIEWLIDQLPEDTTSQQQSKIADIRSLIEESSDVRNNVMARDFQGLLGDLLLQDTGEVIDMIDHREGQQTSRRSIVDELFDDEEQFKSSRRQDVEHPNTPDYVVAGLILGLVLVVTILLVLQP